MTSMALCRTYQRDDFLEDLDNIPTVISIKYSGKQIRTFALLAERCGKFPATVEAFEE